MRGAGDADVTGSPPFAGCDQHLLAVTGFGMAYPVEKIARLVFVKETAA